MLPPYQLARPLPPELMKHVDIYFEEELYTQALDLLVSLLTSATAQPESTQPLPVAPAASHLALAVTLALHPLMTTRTKYLDRNQASLAALDLLKSTLRILGPINGGFVTALEFKHFDSGLTRHGRGQRDHPMYATPIIVNQQALAGSSDQSNDIVDTELRNDFARASSLWVRAEDFWACVGWAFNCSVLRLRKDATAKAYDKRWERWRLWLEFMLDLLEEDWRVRKQVRGTTNVADDKDDDTIVVMDDSQAMRDRLKGSLIYNYIIKAAGDHGRDRRIIRSIFANGDTKSTNEFREIFKNELKEPKKDTGAEAKMHQPAPQVNIEEDIYGDYTTGGADEDDEDEDNDAGERTSSSSRPKRPKRTAATSVADREIPSTTTTDSDTDNNIDPSTTSSTLETTLVPHGTALFGSSASLILRFRLMSLLVGVSVSLASPSPSWTPTTIIDIASLIDLLTEFTKFLPLPLFAAFLSPTLALPYFEPNYYTALCEGLLFRLLEPSAPPTEEPNLTQKKLVHCFLPYAANGTGSVDNAKVSLVLEGLMRTMVREEGYLKYRSSLERAVEEGIVRREGKVRKKAGRGEEIAWTMLRESSARMRDLLQRLK